MPNRFERVMPIAVLASPFCHTGNPVNLVDPDGRIPRIYIQKKQTGHAFITIGEGANTTVYTYGRYGALSPISSGITLGNLNPKGEGVLSILKGNDAESYLQSVKKK